MEVWPHFLCLALGQSVASSTPNLSVNAMRGWSSRSGQFIRRAITPTAARECTRHCNDWGALWGGVGLNG